ncbi:AfsR/SARP family transcriptional regulator [Rhizomonospora bruguierae]|uniref:AfsR/SARP family transcriptional regulator n=1 Tax=Rhizomonospora bruguierae TaxID=1581705 RepID=UPI001BCFE6C3|nr:BTAD domain-containing putative transcriptional regulator [Micromonospora sp. NBRC 107566]
MDVEFRILGRPDVYHDGERLDVGAPKQRAVLTALLLHRNQALTVDRLVDSVWWEPPRAAGSNLRLYLANLRRVLTAPDESGTRVRTMRAGGYQLSVLPGELDLDRFDGLVEQGEQALRAGWLPLGADRLEQAVRLWHGRALDGVTCGPALRAEATRLEERRLTVVEHWARARLALGQPESTITELGSLARENPLREHLWELLMRALCGAGRVSEALAAYEELRAMLTGELGVQPAPELRRLHERILDGDAPATSIGPAAGTPPRQLPAGPAHCYGRSAELTRLRRLLADRSPGPVVVAVDGVAGVGKSVLALAAARAGAARFPDGQLYVNLQGASPGLEPLRPVDVLGRLLRTLGVRPGAVPGDEAEAAALFRSLVAQRRILLLLDDAASADQVRPLLPAGPGCAALITSRQVLGGAIDAHRIPLGVLPGTDAVAMLARLAGPARIAADPVAAGRVAALCGHLPLALRIAGARLAARPQWPLAALADRLATARQRLDELAAGDLAVRSSIELTYRGLPPPARLAFHRLGLLRGRDFPCWALAALLDAPLLTAERLLEQLLTAHLVEPVSEPDSPAPDGTRYRFHDLVRLYAQEQAGTEPEHIRVAAVHRLLGACLSLSERADGRLAADFLGVSRHRQARWSLPRAEADRITADPLAWFERARSFLVAAVEHGLAVGALRLTCCLAASLTAFFQVGNHFPEWRWMQTRALAAAERAGDRRAAMWLHRGLGELDTIQDRYAEAMRHFLAARAAGTVKDPEYEAAIAAGLGYLHRLRGEYEAARAEFTRARALTEVTSNVNGLVYATSGLGVVHLERGRLADAAACFTECLRLSRTAGYLPGEAQALRCLGQVERARTRHERAARYFLRAKRISDGLGDRVGAAHAACWLGEMRVRQGRPAEGRLLLARCLWVHRDFGNAWGEAGALWGLAVAQLAAGRAVAAQRRAAQAVAMWRRIGSPHWLATGIDTLADAHDAAGDLAAGRRIRQEAVDLRIRPNELVHSRPSF